MMGSSSHLIEIKKFMDKCLVCDIEVQDVSLSASGLHVQTNKWLHLEDWLELDSAIEGLLQSFPNSETLEGFETDIFHLGGAIRVDCRKIKMSQAHKKILGAEKLYLPIALHIHITKVSTKALMEQITLFEEKLYRFGESTNKSLVEERKDLLHKENMREYDPTASVIGTEKATNEYAPYTASLKKSNGSSAVDTSLSDNEPYSPKPVSIIESSPDQILESSTEIPTYKPARIAQTRHLRLQDDDETRTEHPQTSRLRKRQSPPTESSKSKCGTSLSRSNALKRRPSRKLKTTNAELFGSDDSEPERFASPPLPAASHQTTGDSPKRIATPLRTPSTNALHKEIKRKRLKVYADSAQKSSLDSWLSKETIERTDKSNERATKRPSRYQSSSEQTTEGLREPSLTEYCKNQNSVELQQIKELSALRDTIKSKRKSPPPAMEILSLTHLSSEDILATFQGIKPKLDKIFKTYSKKTKITGFDGINHMKTLMLIDDKKQLQMMNFLRENYQPNEKGVPSLTDLYINALVPEWTVNVFMKEFNFTRTEAIERLHAQEESSVHQINEGLDSSGTL